MGPLLQVRTRCNIPSELDNITADPIKGMITSFLLFQSEDHLILEDHFKAELTEIEQKLAQLSLFNQIFLNIFFKLGTGPVSSSYSDSLAIRWRRPSEKEAGCRTWSYTVKWRELGGIWKLKELD